ncbi:acyl-CoA carboxylase subunit beta [Paracandidimonas soli]|uniref:Acetyl-CoA carboxylase carboxyltransferase component n=1 Tax=Paracandidimonas soli TaxID=1917182 RepID=A0A4R3VGD9_9BURK|nr:carboxyl transferase domain-containing protein [Paracandidimonas soli]TCV02872.1 acetyl-CoA carboxylase carboxyltransferase component [Paracandidimonas soli]
MAWDEELADLSRRRELAREMGGAEKVARHREKGRLPVRERIEKLVDKDSFIEVGDLAGSAQYDAAGKLVEFMPSNFLTGRARIDGRPVVLAADDFTVRGGSNEGAVGDKLMASELMARDLKLPLIRLVDGTGGGGSVRNIELKGHTLLPKLRMWPAMTQNLANVPVVSMALGSVAGLGAARVTASHYSVMVKETSQMFIAGPPVVARIGQNLDKNELGGSAIHTRNGVCDDEVGSEEQAFERVRRFLSYLPRSVNELPPKAEPVPPQSMDFAWLRDVIPEDNRSVYKMRNIVNALVDQGSFMEIGSKWGRPLITGLARIKGHAVVLFASDPYHYGGAWEKQACEKFVRMLDLAEMFHLPVVNFVDIPGFQIGLEAEKSGAMRYGVRALTAVAQSTVPWCTFIIRKAFGVAAGGHQSDGRFNFRYAWPSAQWGSLPIEGGLEVAYKAEIAASDDPEAKLKEIEARVRSLTSPFRSAEAFVVENIVDPVQTRDLLEEFVDVAAPLMQPGPRAFSYRP